MARIVESIEIKCPVDKVFAYTTDAGSWSQWQSIIPVAEQISRGSIGVDTIFKGTVHMMGLSMKWTAKTTEYEPTVKFSKNITSTAMTIEQHNIYDNLEGGVKFTIAYNIKVRGLFKLFSPVLSATMRKELKKSLNNLKGILETQT